MTASPEITLGRWRHANRVASDAERILFDAWFMYLWQGAARPTGGEVAQVERLRARSNGFFQVVAGHFASEGVRRAPPMDPSSLIDEEDAAAMAAIRQRNCCEAEMS